MRNLKRALSLALASVMLLGMMVVGSSAAFADADDIVNTEAVEITAGLGLFAGSDGKFNPKGNVTRAQMATVIVKMLYGSEINADQYKGNGKFNDVAAFEGGWAEGYINLCANLGIVGGYGDGTFKPGNSVTTAEAVTMVINALGVDAGKGTWPMTVMAKAEEIELFEDMVSVKPGTNVALTRDQLAVIAWNGLNYSAEGVLGYEIKNVDLEFKTLADVIAYADAKGIDLADINEVKGDTLAKEVFGVKTDKGYITANQATGEKSTWIGGDEDYNIETTLAQLGHYVTVYYSEVYETEKKPGTAYAVVELAEYVTVEKAIDKKADYIAAFGGKVESAIEIANYDEKAFTAPVGTYVISTDEDNNEGKIIAFIAPVAANVGEVTAVSEVAGKEYIKIGSKKFNNNEDEDVIVAYDGIAEDDIVVYKQYNDSEGNTMTYVYKPEVVSGKITKTKDASGDYSDRIWVNGTEYEMDSDLSGTIPDSLLEVYSDFDMDNDAENTYDVYLYNGKAFGLKETAGTASIGDVIYVTNGYTGTVGSNYGTENEKTSYYVQGVNAEGKEVSILVGIQDCAKDPVKYPVIDDFENDYGYNAFYTFKKSADTDQAKKDIMLPTPVIDIDKPFNADEHDYFTAAVEAVNAADTAFAKDSKYVTITTTGENDRVYLTANTKYLIVDDTKGIADLKVGIYTGAISKDISGENTKVDVIATEDDNENRYAQLVVIYAESGLAAEDYIYVSNIAYADASKVQGGYQLKAYFSEINDFKTIVADEKANGFYTEWEINEDGVYELVSFESDEGVFAAQLLNGVVGDAIITDGGLDLADATGVKIYDMRDPEIIEDSEVAEIATLKDLQVALGDKKNVYFDAIVDVEDADEPVVTHIFVYSVETFVEKCDGSAYTTEEVLDGWFEDDGTTYSKKQLCVNGENVSSTASKNTAECENCGLKYAPAEEEEGAYNP